MPRQEKIETDMPSIKQRMIYQLGALASGLGLVSGILMIAEGVAGPYTGAISAIANMIVAIGVASGDKMQASRTVVAACAIGYCAAKKIRDRRQVNYDTMIASILCAGMMVEFAAML